MGEPEPPEQTPGHPQHPLSRLTWRCTLASGVNVRHFRGRPYLVCERPLAVLEVRPRALRLLARLAPGRSVTISDPPAAELRFMRRLVALRLLELRPRTSVWPSVTVVVPVRDRPAELAACLESLARVSYPGRLEVLVVDDGSIRPAAARGGVRMMRLPNSLGPGAARNAGVAECATELVAFIDSDCVAEPGWLEALVPELCDPAVAAAGGRVLGAGSRGWLERYEAVRSPLDLGATPAMAGPGTSVPYLVTASMVVRRTAFQAAGGFDPYLRWGEDVDLCWRLDSAGHRLVYRPDSLVRHRHRGEPGEFVRTRRAYAASEAALLDRHPQNGRWLGLSPGMAGAVIGALGALLGRPRLLAAGCLTLALEVSATAGTLRSLGVPRRTSVPALLRGQASVLYHVARQVVRYYGAPSVLVAVASGRRSRRRLLAAWATAELVPAVVDWWRLASRLSLPAFLAAYVLDDVAYQAGLLAGCLQHRSGAALRVHLGPAAGRPKR